MSVVIVDNVYRFIYFKYLLYKAFKEAKQGKIQGIKNLNDF